jgi:hypothetical protein
MFAPQTATFLTRLRFGTEEYFCPIFKFKSEIQILEIKRFLNYREKNVMQQGPKQMMWRHKGAVKHTRATTCKSSTFLFTSVYNSVND